MASEGDLMDVKKALFGVVAILIFSACAPDKTPESVMNDTFSKTCGGQKLNNSFIVEWEDGRFTVEADESLENFKENFIRPRLSEIKRVGFNRTIELDKPVMADPDEVQTQAYGQWAPDKVEAPYLWNLGLRGDGVVIGVVDTSVDINHAQLSGRVAVNSGEIPDNGIDDDKNGFVDDVYGASFVTMGSADPAVNSHGTHVAGIIAADPALGAVSGIAPGAKIVPAPFLGGASGLGDLGSAIQAMKYTAARGAKIINASWGGAACDLTLYSAFANLSERGILLVVASGNNSRNLDNYPLYPASFLIPHQITVGASNVDDFMPSWSNSGYTAVQLAAPGVGILSTVAGNSYGYMDGTSMAAPLVSGAAALLWQARPSATAAQIHQALIRSVDIVPGHEFRVSTRGRVNLRKAYLELLRLVP